VNFVNIVYKLFSLCIMFASLSVSDYYDILLRPFTFPKRVADAIIFFVRMTPTFCVTPDSLLYAERVRIPVSDGLSTTAFYLFVSVMLGRKRLS
jgi:hypothetical protein